MIPYLLHSSILLSGCFIFYWLFIRQETFFKLNRWVLISGILLSVLIPLIHVPEQWSLRETSLTESVTVVEPVVSTLPASQVADQPLRHSTINPSQKETVVSIPESASAPIATAASNGKAISFTTVLWYLYLTGVVVFFLAFLVQLIILLTKTYTLVSFKDGRYRIVELVKNEAPYSFWNSIFINPTKYDLETYTQIIDHEKIHIKQAHFFDKLLAEIALIAFWFNPFVWMLRNAITNNLEYLTDSSMLEKGTEKQTYQMSLLKVSVPQHPLNLSTNYNNSFLKNRIAMMNAKKSSASSSWKYLFLLPLIGFSMICLNEVQSKQITPSSETAMMTSQQDSISPTEIKEIERLEELAQQEKIELIEAQVEIENAQAEIENAQVEIERTKIELIEAQVEVENAAVEIRTEALNFVTNNQHVHIDEHHNMNMTNGQWNNNLRPGHWTGEIDGERVCFQLNNSRPAKGWTSISTECFKRSELSELPKEEDKDFFIKRTAGTLKMNGSFTGDFGDGTFSFEGDPSFLSYLKSEGMDVSKEHDQYHLFLNDINKDYIATLKKQGFKANGRDLINLSVHGVDQEELQGFVGIFKDLDYKGYRISDLIQFKIHDVNPEYVNEIRAQGMTDLTVSEVVQAKIHDVDPAFIKSVRDYGLDVGLNDVIQFAIHDVDIEYIQELKNLGFRNLSNQDIIQSSIHDVDADYIRAINDAGFTDMKMSDLIQFSIHDIDVKFIKELQDYGMKDLSIHHVVQLAIHDVDVEYLKEMKALGFRDLDDQEIIQAKIHDVDPDFIRALQAQGLGDMDMSEIVQFAIHDIDVDDITAFKAAGFDFNTQDIIRAGIHDVSAKYIKQMKAMGFENENLDDFINARIHGVNPSFIKRAREKGHNPKTLKEYVHLKLGGM